MTDPDQMRPRAPLPAAAARIHAAGKDEEAAAR